MDREQAITLAVSDVQLEKWAERITRRYRKLVEGALVMGQDLNRIKARCPHGSFERLFTGHPHAVATAAPFGIRTAQMFMAIANHPILSQANHGSSLPSSYRTLYELSRLPIAVLTKALEEGLIHPEMERQDVALLQEPREWTPRRAPTTPRAQANAKREISDTLRRLWTRYPEAREHMLTEMTALARAHDLRFPAVMATLKAHATRLTATQARDVFGLNDDDLEETR